MDCPSDMESALSTISVFPETRKEMDAFKWDIKRDLKAGIVSNPLKVKVQLTMLKTLIEELLEDEDVDLVFLKEFELYDAEREIAINGAKLMKREVGVKYDYDSSGDPVWNKLNKVAKEVTDEKKRREKLLQSMDDKGMVDPETGVFISKPVKTSKTKVVCVLP